MTTSEDHAAEPAFDEWGWAEHERAQRRRYAQLPLEDKIRWLEEAHRLVLTLHEDRSARAADGPGDHVG